MELFLYDCARNPELALSFIDKIGQKRHRDIVKKAFIEITVCKQLNPKLRKRLENIPIIMTYDH